jgi:hypothetical protein
MAFTPTTAWRIAMEQDSPEIVYLVRIGDVLTGFKSISGKSDTMDYPNAVSGIGTIGDKVDPLTKEVTDSLIVVSFIEDWIRPYVVASQIKGELLHVSIGERRLDESDFLFLAAGLIEDYVPQNNGIELTINAKTVLTALRGVKSDAIFGPTHPAEAMESLLVANAPGSLVLTTDFDPGLASLSDYTHYVISRGSGNPSSTDPIDKVAKKETVYRLLIDACRLINAQLVFKDDGKIGLVVYDPTTIADHWDASVFGGDIKQGASEENTINNVVCGIMGTEGEEVTNITFEDTTSSARNSIDPAVPRLFEYKLNSAWLQSSVATAQQWDSSITDSETTVLLYSPQFNSLSGMRYTDFEAGTAPSWVNRCDASHPAYFLIHDFDEENTNEIVKVTNWSVDPDYVGRKITLDPFVGNLVGGEIAPFAGIATFARGQFGSTARAHYGKPVTRIKTFEVTTPISLPVKKEPSLWIDITPTILAAQAILDRFADGPPTVTIQAPMSKAWLNRGDMVTLETDRIYWLNHDGVNAGTGAWEIVGRSVDPAKNGLVFTLVFAGSAASPSLSYTGVSRPYFSNRLRAGRASLKGSLTHIPVVPVEIVATTGREIQIRNPGASAGVFSHLNSPVIYKTLPASKDTFIYQDPVDGHYLFYSVSSGGSPQYIHDLMPLAKVSTDATSVTAISYDNQEVAAVSADRIIGQQAIIKDSQNTGNLVPNGEFQAASYGIENTVPDNWNINTDIVGIPAAQNETVWGPSSEFYFDDTFQATGGRSMKLMDTGSTSLLHVISQRRSDYIPIEELVPYRVRFLAAASTVATAGMYIRIEVDLYDSSKTNLGYFTVTANVGAAQDIKTANTFYDKSLSAFIAHQYATIARFARIVVNANTQRQTMWLDSVSLERVECYGRYSTPGALMPLGVTTLLTPGYFNIAETTCQDITYLGATYGAASTGTACYFDAPYDGQFTFTVSQTINVANAFDIGQEVECGIAINGTPYDGSRVPIGGSQVAKPSYSCSVRLVRGDRVVPYHWNNCVGAISQTAASRFAFRGNV